MYPSLPAGSYLLVAPHPYRASSEVSRGDVVMFVRNENGAEYRYIWRVVGLPGDSVKAAGQAVAINGNELPKQAVREDGALAIFRETNGSASYEVAYPRVADGQEPPPASLTVPPNTFFLMGDNRYNARDSRYFGPIALEAIIGRKVWAP
jgi:signal peptidase I